MSMTDPIGDLITRIRNAQQRAKSKVSTPASKLRERVLEVLKTEGYIRGYATVAHSDGRSEIEIELKYFDGAPVIREIARVSKPGRRVYVSVKNLPRINNGLGVAVVSTPKGVMADHAARDANVGGEILFTVFCDKGSDHVPYRQEGGRDSVRRDGERRRPDRQGEGAEGRPRVRAAGRGLGQDGERQHQGRPAQRDQARALHVGHLAHAGVELGHRGDQGVREEARDH